MWYALKKKKLTGYFFFKGIQLLEKSRIKFKTLLFSLLRVPFYSITSLGFKTGKGWGPAALRVGALLASSEGF